MSCPDCFKGSVHNHGEPKGKMETVYGTSCYVAGPSATKSSKSSILFITDAFGLNLINNKLLADRFAQDTGCRVLVPELIPGGGASVDLINQMAVVTKPVALTDVSGQFSRVFTIGGIVSSMAPFMYRSRMSIAYPPILKFAREMRKNLPPGGKLGVAGYCWGGLHSTKLCVEPAVEGSSEHLIDAQYCAHPSNLDVPKMIVDAIANKVPYSMAVGDQDMVMSEKAVLNVQQAVRDQVGPPEENNYEIKIYPGCPHGFAARANPDVEVEVKASEDAALQAINWYNKYLN